MPSMLGVLEYSLELPLLVHLHEQVTAANELALDVNLNGHNQEVRTRRSPHSGLMISANTESMDMPQVGQ